eukprot:6392973-Prymnesium_polylepis.1
MGGSRLANIALAAPERAPLPIFGLTFLLACLLSLFVEHAAWQVGTYLFCVAKRACLRAGGATERAVRACPG